MENDSALRLVVNSQTVDVFDRDGRLLQSLPFDGETPDADNREFFAIAEDMNFDGLPDVRILFSRGMVNLYYDWWLWNPEKNAFVEYLPAREFANPVFDPASKRIFIYERGSALAHASGELTWENGNLAWHAKTIQDEADDLEHIVISRYLRDSEGELRLVSEDTIRPERLDEERIGNACLPPALPGLNLVLDLHAEPLDAAALPNGEWWLLEGTKYRTLLIESRRLPAMEYDEDSARGLIGLGWPSAREIAIEPFEALAEKTGYPSLKAGFLVGKNEDMRRFVAALVFAKEWSFWFVLGADADAEFTPDEMDAPNTVAIGGELKREMETLLLGIRPADPREGGFLPGFVPMVHIAGEDSLVRIRVMDALIRIKKIVGPEHSPWVGPFGMAYRYEGTGSLGGAPALFFSFGTENVDKYAAERRFAVDETGAVYEMDAAGDGNYWQWEEWGVLWWGEYRRGDMVLRISNYREGPGGMYFVFEFTEGTKTVFEGTAPVRGRTACYDSLGFAINRDDSVITVMIDPGVDGMMEENLSRLAGTYAAE